MLHVCRPSSIESALPIGFRFVLGALQGRRGSVDNVEYPGPLQQDQSVAVPQLVAVGGVVEPGRNGAGVHDKLAARRVIRDASRAHRVPASPTLLVAKNGRVLDGATLLGIGTARHP